MTPNPSLKLTRYGRLCKPASAGSLARTLGVMNITRASAADAEAISALIHLLSHHFLARPDGQETTAFFAATNAASMAKHIEDPARLYLLAKSSDTLLGFISLKDRTRISQFFVHPEHQRQGIGSALWQAALSASLASQGADLTVDSSQYALNVYRHFGFVADGPITQAGGVVYTPMRRRARDDA